MDHHEICKLLYDAASEIEHLHERAILLKLAREQVGNTSLDADDLDLRIRVLCCEIRVNLEASIEQLTVYCDRLYELVEAEYE